MSSPESSSRLISLLSDWNARRQAGEECDPAEFARNAPSAGTSDDTTPESIDTPIVII